MEKFSYTIEQIQKISTILNEIEVKGRNNHRAIELIFQTLDEGEKTIIEDVGDE